MLHEFLVVFCERCRFGMETVRMRVGRACVTGAG